MTVEELICKLMRVRDSSVEVVWDSSNGPVEYVIDDGYQVRIW